MNSIKEFLINNGEKVFFGVVLAFCLYSIMVSVFGLLSGSKDYETIGKYVKEIKNGLKKPSTVQVQSYNSDVDKILSDRNDTEHIAPFNKLVQKKIFSEKTKGNIYKPVEDIINGHANVSSAPGENCSKYFAKVDRNDTCIVCGSKGERVYIFKSAILTDLKSLSNKSQKELVSNPFVDRKTIRIIWEDSIESDRTNYKERKALVYRFEADKSKLAEINLFINKPEYQKAAIDFIKKHKLVPQKDKSGKLVVIKPKQIEKKEATENTPVQEEENPDKIDDIFKDNGENEDKEKPVNDKKIPENKNMNKLINEKVFYIYEDTNFEALKKYMYILIVHASGKSANGKKIEERKYSNPVEVNTNAENLVFLTKVVEKKNAPGEYQASFRIYQYFKLQNGFYKVNLGNLAVKDPIGHFARKSTGVKKKIPLTRIFKLNSNPKAKRALLKGTDFNTADWKKWKALYPSMKNRKLPVSINLKFATGFEIIKIGIELNKKVVQNVRMVKKLDADGKPEYDEDGKEIMIPKITWATRNTGFVELQNVLTKKKKKIYVEKNNIIKLHLEKQKINVIGN